jgi:hypothetical protein
MRTREKPHLDVETGAKAVVVINLAAQSYREGRTLYWDAGRQLFADTPSRQKFSQHTNTLAVLADIVSGEEARALMLRTLTAPALAQGALYFKFYMHQALAKVGEGDRYLEQLDDWRGMLATGLTTFAEVVNRPDIPPVPTATPGCSPNIELMRPYWCRFRRPDSRVVVRPWSKFVRVRTPPERIHRVA